MESTQIHGLVITIIRKSIKNLYLRLKGPVGDICITVPKRTSVDTINQFVTLKLDWIKKQQARVQQQKLLLDKGLESGEYIQFQGEAYLLNTIYNKGTNRVILDSNNKIFNLYVNKRGILSLRAEIVNNFFKYTIDEQLMTLLPKWQNKIGVSINGYRFRNMKSRWGSCDINKKIICLNLQLAKLPPVCLEYVLVHELVHLLERRHNKRFYSFMTKFMPGWQDYEKTLNTTFLK